MKHRAILHQLFIVSSTLTLLCYSWLVLPPSFTQTPGPAIVFYALGQGFAPRMHQSCYKYLEMLKNVSVVLLVIIVPTLVSSSYVPTTLGAHKSVRITRQWILSNHQQMVSAVGANWIDYISNCCRSPPRQDEKDLGSAVT